MLIDTVTLIRWLRTVTMHYPSITKTTLHTTTISTSQPEENLSKILSPHNTPILASGLPFIAILHHFFPNHMKNPNEITSSELSTQLEMAWTLAHEQLEMRIVCKTSSEFLEIMQKPLSTQATNIIRRLLEIYFVFFNGKEVERSIRERQEQIFEDISSIQTSASSLVSLVGQSMSSPSSPITTKSQNSPITPQPTTFVTQQPRKPLPSIPKPIPSTTTQQPSKDDQVQNTITKLVLTEEEKKQPVFFRGTAIVEKEDSENYYNFFKL